MMETDQITTTHEKIHNRSKMPTMICEEPSKEEEQTSKSFQMKSFVTCG